MAWIEVGPNQYYDPDTGQYEDLSSVDAGLWQSSQIDTSGGFQPDFYSNYLENVMTGQSIQNANPYSSVDAYKAYFGLSDADLSADEKAFFQNGTLPKSSFAGLGDTNADIYAGLFQQGGMSAADSATLGGELANQGFTIGQVTQITDNMSPSMWTEIQNMASRLGTTPTNLFKQMTTGSGGTSGTGGVTTPGLLGMLATGAGGYLTGQSATDAAKINADAQLAAAKVAADAAKFKPVGVSTRFGGSNFGFDANGNLTSAGYLMSPEAKALQDQLMGMTPGMLDQYEAAKAATAPMSAAGDRAMALGNQYLATDPAAQAAKYMAEQQALLAPSRERDLATLQNQLQQQGRAGMATGGTSTGMMAANPEMEAFYNAQRQQDMQLAAQATQGGQQYATYGAGLVGTGGDLYKGMYGTQTAAYNPYQTALGGAQTLEGLAQNALTQGTSLGSSVTAANASSGSLLAQGMQNAAASNQQANSYSPWGSLLSGAGNALSQYQNTQQQQPYAYNPYTGQPVRWGT